MKPAETIIQQGKLGEGILINNVALGEQTLSQDLVLDQAYSGLRTDNHSPIGWTELSSEDMKCPDVPEPRP